MQIVAYNFGWSNEECASHFHLKFIETPDGKSYLSRDKKLDPEGKGWEAFQRWLKERKKWLHLLSL